MPAIYPDTPGDKDPGEGVRLGIDVGTVRIGVARSNREATMAMPLETVARTTQRGERDGSDIDRLEQLAREYQAVEVVVGLPRDLKGNGSQSAKHAADIAHRLRRRLKRDKNPVPVRLGDERLTTVVATQALRSSGVSAKKSRHVVDQAAAVEILQTWLDGRKNALAAAEDTTGPTGVDNEESEF